MFETVSGFTTTGSSILSDVEALAKCSLFWRSFTHWIGGMGVFVFVLAVIAADRRSEYSSDEGRKARGRPWEKLVPKNKKDIHDTLQNLYCNVRHYGCFFNDWKNAAV